MLLFLTLFVKILLIASVNGKKGYGPGEQDWGYIDIFEGAHMFYWLYYTQADVSNYTERPLVIWLQGGPGASASGHANFQYLGPIYMNGDSREYTWVNYVNLLLVDNPLGAGFSYVDNLKLLSRTNREISKNLVEFMKGFFKIHPEFEDVPFHIFCESYAGKFGVEFALELWQAINIYGTVRSKLKTVNMANPWISTEDQYNAAPDAAYEMGIVDDHGREFMRNELNRSLELINQGLWEDASKEFLPMGKSFCKVSEGINFFNVQDPVAKKDTSNCAVSLGVELKLSLFMNFKVKTALSLPFLVLFGAQRDNLIAALSSDIFKSMVHIVEELLDTTDLKLNVFSGNSDLIVPTSGILGWINKLKWSKKSEYVNASRNAYFVNNILEGYEKSGGGLSMIWIIRAGHLVVLDNPSTLAYFLKEITGVN